MTDLEQYTYCAIHHARSSIAEEKLHQGRFRTTGNFQFKRYARRDRRGAHVSRILCRSKILSELRGVRVWLAGSHHFKIANTVG